MNDVLGMPDNVVVLGGASDLARAILRRLAAFHLRKVVLAGRDPSSLAVAAGELELLGVGSVELAHFDALETHEHDAMAQRVRASGSIDLLLVATGTLGTADLDLLDAESVASALDTNFSGLAAAMTAFAKIMREDGHGQIVVLSSAAGARVRRSNFVYGAAKAGLDGFSQGLSYVLEGSGVNVMIVRPGFVYTKMTAGLPGAPFAVQPDVVADAVVRGLERRSSVIWVPSILGVALRIAQLVPRRIWRSLPM